MAALHSSHMTIDVTNWITITVWFLRVLLATFQSCVELTVQVHELHAVIMSVAYALSAGLLQPLVKELTNEQDPLTCLAALSLLKEQIQQASNTTLKLLLAEFFLPHLEQLLTRADSIIKPTAMQAQHSALDKLPSCHLHSFVV